MFDMRLTEIYLRAKVAMSVVGHFPRAHDRVSRKFCWPVIICAACVSTASCGHSSVHDQQRSDESKQAISSVIRTDFVVCTLRDSPAIIKGVSYEPKDQLGIVVKGSKQDRVLRRLTGSACFHLLLLDGPDARVRPGQGCSVTVGDEATSIAVLDILLDEREAIRHLGNPALIRTRTGIRFPTDRQSLNFTDRANESHRDQGLSTLGALGVPCSQQIVCGSEAYSVRDILQDAVATFDPAARELEWTAMSLLFYMDPHATWTNRFGAIFSFDHIAKELLSRPLSAASCGGTHLLILFSALLDVDDNDHMLSLPVRAELQARLREALLTALARQAPDGHWESYQDLNMDGFGGFVERSADNSVRSRQATTAHVVLWLRTLPVQFRIPNEISIRAAQWLHASLEKVEPTDFWTDVCTATHVLAVLSAAGFDAPSQYSGTNID